jgi:hypothetical protein
MIAVHINHPLLATKRDISITTDDLTKRMEMWRKLQELHMPSVSGPNGTSMTKEVATTVKAAEAKAIGMEVESEAIGMEVESEVIGKERVVLAAEKKLEAEVTIVDGTAMEIAVERLYLPSEFNEVDRFRLDLVNLAEEEEKLREGHAFECILQLRRLMKTMSALQLLRKKNTRGQRQNTRAHTQCCALELTCDRLLEVYNTSQKSLTSIYTNDMHISEQLFNE